MIRASCLFTLIIVTNFSFAQKLQTLRLSSPDKQTVLSVSASNDGALLYSISFSGKQLLNPSALGVHLNGKDLGSKCKITGSKRKTVSEKIPWPLGEQDVIQSSYNELTVSCNSGEENYIIRARAFDGSIAFRYEINNPAKALHTVKSENTAFNFAEPYTLYQYHHETVFTPVRIDTFNSRCDFPATLTNGKLFISVGEAANTNYTKAELQRGNIANGLTVAYPRDSIIKMNGSFITPWRTISFATSAINMHRFSQLNFKLNPPATFSATSIKPGKLIRSQLNTQSAIDCTDFAANHHFQYIMFDAGWYGAEFRGSSDPTQPIAAIDMQQVIDYGKQKGIGVILYVNYVGLKAKLDTIIPLYKKWGVAGMKFGFVDGLTQEGIKWLVAAIKKVNDSGFVLNIHDNYKPTGLSRTYPALLTQEGIRGNENSPDAFHNTVLPFTRFLAGAADYTFCYPNEKNSFSRNLHVSKAHQLALPVIYYSPLQAIFWYGQPKDYTNELEIEFFKLVPTVWNESHYLSGEIGKHISVARRKGDIWYLGTVAGPADFHGDIPLNFLTKGKKYTATIYEDDGAGSIRKRSVNVKKGDLYGVALKAATGQAIQITPN
jgi:alpha-glucosidase